MKKIVSSWIFLALLVLAAPALAQISEIGGFEEPSFHLRGADIPLYFVVESFFQSQSRLSKQWDDSYERFLAEHMGIDPQGPAAAVLMEAVKAADPILEMKTINVDLADDPKAYVEHQYFALKRKALDLRQVFIKMVAELKRSGFSEEKLMAVLDREFRTGMSITSVGGPFEGSLSEIVKIFEDPDFGKDEELIFVW